MADKPIPPNSDDQDSWENLAKDLFGVEFDSPPVSPDDLDDELLNDDFLNDETEPEASDVTSESDESAAQEESPAEAEEIEPAAVTFSAAEEAEQTAAVAESSPGDLDALLDFSKPYGDEEIGEAVAEPEPVTEETATTAPEASLFEKLAPESEEAEEEEPVEWAEDEEDDFESEDDSDEQLDTDDFWDALEKFAPEELGTPHIDMGQPRGGRPPRDPEIGLVADAPENEISESSSFETGFATDSDFGLGVLEDVETDEDDDTEAAEGELAGDTGEEPGEAKKPKRRRRRRRRGGRRKKPVADREEDVAEAEEEQPDDEELSDEELSDEEFFDEEREDESQTSRSAGDSRYKNIPTWSEAIDLIADRRAKSGSESRGRRGNRSDTRNRKRGGRRRRSRKS